MQELEQSYWCGNGKYQEINESLAKHIPAYGESEDEGIELLRCATNIYYDCYNNGGCNLGVKIHELRQIVQYRPQIVPSLMTSEAWNGIIPHLLRHAIDMESCDKRTIDDLYDDDDDWGSMYLPKDWSKVNLELLFDAIVLLVQQNLSSTRFL